MVTTLLDAAPADRTAPTRAEAVDLLVAGMRHRLRVRGSAVVAAIATSIYAAVAFAALGGFVGWQTASALPGDADAARLVRAALPPGAALPAAQRWDFVFGDTPGYLDPPWLVLLAGTDAYTNGQVFFDLPYADATMPATSRDARQRLTAAGWTPDPATGTVTSVHRDGRRIEIARTYRMGEEDPVLRFAVTRAAPAAVLPLTPGGLLLGALTGWLVTAWAWRRGRDAGPLRSVGRTALFSGGLVALSPATLLSVFSLIESVLRPIDPVPAWGGYTFVFARALAWLGGLGVFGAVLLTAARRRSARRTAPGRAPA
jgi:hypothetical protein